MAVVPGGELIIIGATAATGWYDPAEHRLFLDPRSDVTEGTLITLRGSVRRVTGVETWTDGGVVAHLEPGQVYLPDEARLTRVTEGDFDDNTGTRPDVEETLWTGECLVNATASATASDPAVGDWRTELVLYEVKLPVTVTDIQQGDRVKIIHSHDPGLENKTLYVVRVLAESHAQERIVHCAERQI